MNLVNELQVSAEQDDVLTVLRKTKRLASKLGRQEILDWLQAEQAGYPTGQPIADYRRVRSSIAYNTNGYVPAGWGYMKNGIEDLPIGSDFPVEIRDPISTILSFIEGVHKTEGGNLFIPIEEGSDFSRLIRSTFRFNELISHQITFVQRINFSQYRAIPEQIKDKVLDWACNLEAAGVCGDGMSFTAKEKEISHAITFNISGCNIDQLNNMGTNRKG